MKNRGHTATHLPFIKIADDTLIRPADGPRWESDDGSDIYMPVEIEIKGKHKLRMAHLHTELDVDGTFYHGYIGKRFEAEAELRRRYAVAGFEDLRMLWYHFVRPEDRI